jgi:ketosteroid isomerase-like protein
MVLSWLASKLLGYAMARLRAGDTRLITLLYAPDVELTFPGENSFSGVYRGQQAVSGWLARFAALGLQIFPDEIVAVGPPWHTTVCVRGHVWLRDDTGGTVYENRYVIWGQLRWGRMHSYEVYENTGRADALDAWVAEHRPELAAPVPHGLG